MRWDTVLFDMDGTLTDSQEGIVKSVSYALERLGRELPPRDTLTAFIGPPLHAVFTSRNRKKESKSRHRMEK